MFLLLTLTSHQRKTKSHILKSALYRSILFIYLICFIIIHQRNTQSHILKSALYIFHIESTFENIFFLRKNIKSTFENIFFELSIFSILKRALYISIF